MGRLSGGVFIAKIQKWVAGNAFSFLLLSQQKDNCKTIGKSTEIRERNTVTLNERKNKGKER